MKLIQAGNMRYLNKKTYKVAVLILAILFAGTSIVMAEYPIVVGMHQVEAEKTLREKNITWYTIYGIANGYQERVVFNQEVNGSALNIFVNKRLDYLRVKDKTNDSAVDLSQSQEDRDKNAIYSNSIIVVEGRLLSDMETNEHLWIAVRPDSSIANWWPQSNGDLKPNKQRVFQGNAFLGGGEGDLFTVGIFILNDTLNRIFTEWETHSNNKKSWPPITQGDPVTGNKVSKNTIEDTALLLIKIKLIEEKIMLQGKGKLA